MLSKTILIGLTSLFLTACGVLSAPAPTTQTIKLYPPVEWLADCPVPPKPSNPTNGELAKWLNEHEAALASCNTDKALLRDYYAQ